MGQHLSKTKNKNTTFLIQTANSHCAKASDNWEAETGVVGYLVAQFYRHEQGFIGAFTVASVQSNNGPTVGGFICFL